MERPNTQITVYFCKLWHCIDHALDHNNKNIIQETYDESDNQVQPICNDKDCPVDTETALVTG